MRNSFTLGRLMLCEARLYNEARFPWIILVPQVDNAVEWIDLKKEDQLLVVEDINAISRILKTKLTCDKINIATIGNVVPQLHIHVVGRFFNDPLWPRPVFGTPLRPYEPAALTKTITAWQEWLK